MAGFQQTGPAADVSENLNGKNGRLSRTRKIGKKIEKKNTHTKNTKINENQIAKGFLIRRCIIAPSSRIQKCTLVSERNR
jgi:hypothetical protein